MTGHRSRPCTRSSLTFSPISRRSSMVRSDSASPRSSTCGRRVCRRENASSWRTSVAGAGGVLLDLHDVLERRIGRLVRVQQEVVRHHDGGQHVVEVVRDAAGELADHLHLLRLVDLVLQRAPFGGLQQIDDRGLGLALVLLDRGDEELPPALAARPSSIASTGAMSPCPSAAWLIAAISRLRSRALTAAEDRLVGGAVGAEALRQLGKAGIGAHHRAGAVHGGDRHRAYDRRNA